MARKCNQGRCGPSCGGKPFRLTAPQDSSLDDLYGDQPLEQIESGGSLLGGLLLLTSVAWFSFGLGGWLLYFFGR